VELRENPEDRERSYQEKLVKVISETLLRYPEVLQFTQLADHLGGTMEFRLRLAHRPGGTTTGDSKERKDV
jgi:hypothetical protein